MISKRTHWQECEVPETLRVLNPKMGIYTLVTYSRQKGFTYRPCHWEPGHQRKTQ